MEHVFRSIFVVTGALVVCQLSQDACKSVINHCNASIRLRYTSTKARDKSAAHARRRNSTGGFIDFGNVMTNTIRQLRARPIEWSMLKLRDTSSARVIFVS